VRHGHKRPSDERRAWQPNDSSPSHDWSVLELGRSWRHDQSRRLPAGVAKLQRFSNLDSAAGMGSYHVDTSRDNSRTCGPALSLKPPSRSRFPSSSTLLLPFLLDLPDPWAPGRISCRSKMLALATGCSVSPPHSQTNSWTLNLRVD
jgi:hypothetical protein